MCGVRVSGFWLNTYSVAKGFNWRLFSSRDKILIQRVNMVKFNSVSNYWTNILSAINSQQSPQKIDWLEREHREMSRRMNFLTWLKKGKGEGGQSHLLNHMSNARIWVLLLKSVSKQATYIQALNALTSNKSYQLSPTCCQNNISNRFMMMIMMMMMMMMKCGH